MNDAVIGKEVDGYRIQAVLGRGGMGTVYKAEDVNLSRTVAIKRINPGQQERESFIHRFRSEAQALARIDSPNIVGVYALRETDIGLLIVMEYVEGGTLKDPIERQGAMAPAQALPILEQTMQAFHDAHSAGVIHRDIKPENVMLTTDGMVKVTDFGIAKLRQPDSGETVTQGGQGGTLKYMSPEQISNISEVDARSDLYSLGMTAYEILAGDLPFEDTDTDFGIMRKVVEGKIPPPDELNAEIPSGLAQWIMGAIEKRQDDRYQSAEEMLEALRKADRQSGGKTITQPDWEVDDGSADVDETRTIVPEETDPGQTEGPDEGDADQTQTVVPEEGDGSEKTGGETVMAPEGATQPSVPEAETDPASATESGADEDAAEDEMSWVVVGGGIVATLILIAGGALVYAQLGGGGGAATATLALDTAPAGATVLVNGDTAGTTPINSHTVEAGTVQLLVRKEGYAGWDTTLTGVKGGRRVALQDVTLAELRADESATMSADNAKGASSDGGGESEQVANTTEQASADASGATPTTENQDTPPDPSASDAADVETGGAETATGTVEVTPEPSGTVWVDGQQQRGGAIPLEVGQHTITCRHQDYGSVDTTLTVSEGQPQTLSCHFQQQVTVNTAGGTYGQIWLNGEVTNESTPSTLTLSPGTYRIEVRRKTLEGFQVEGGITKTERGESSTTERFSGDAYRIRVEPTFTRVEHAVVFNVSRE